MSDWTYVNEKGKIVHAPKIEQPEQESIIEPIAQEIQASVCAYCTSKDSIIGKMQGQISILESKITKMRKVKIVPPPIEQPAIVGPQKEYSVSGLGISIMIFLWALLLTILLGCSTASTKRKTYNSCVDSANESFQTGLSNYIQRTDRVKSCLSEYNR